MFRDEACLPAIAASSAETPRAKTRAHQTWNFPYAAPVEQRSLLAPHETVRSYIVITAIALGLMAVWAAIVPFVA